MKFSEWIDTFLEEKGLNLEETFEVEGPSGTNYMNYKVVIEAIKTAPVKEQNGIKDVIIKLDYYAADVRDFLRHLAKALAI
jgi:hypothetical protein